MSQSLLFILRVATDIFVLILLVRALLQLVQADFYNPISQTVFKICAPLVEPLRKVLPTIGRLNLAAVVAALLVQWAFYVIILAISGQLSPQLFAYLAVAAFDVLSALVEIYFWGIFILVISSWVGQIVEPYMRPFRNLIPPIGMIDISPMVAIFALMLIQSRLLPMIGGLIKPMLG
jgi:YggT family protein